MTTNPRVARERPIKVAFVGDEAQIARVFGRGRREAVETRAEVLPGVLGPGDARLANVEAIFSTWGMPLLGKAQLDAMPSLRGVFYAAGDVRGFALPLIARGIVVSSAWQANAIPVAEFTLAQILLAGKRYFANLRDYAAHPGRRHASGPGAYGETVALLGAGAIGRRVIDFLRPFRLDVGVFDPFLSDENAEAWGVRKVTLEAAFREGHAVSNHLLDVPETQGIVTERLLASLREGATFINTGRGRTVDMDGLVRVLGGRPDLTALLDVTDPAEPLPADHPLWALPNAFLTSHIAGSTGDEVLRMADWAIEEFDRFRRGEPLLYRVDA